MLEDNSTLVQMPLGTSTLIKIPLFDENDQPKVEINEQTSTITRRRKDESKVNLNLMLLKTTEKLLSRDKLRLFGQRVKEKDAPGYFNLIITPIDLSVIKARCKRNDYKTASDYLDDVSLMAANA